jgi:hypothetical protein
MHTPSWTCGGIGIFGIWGSIRPEMATKTYENGGKWYIKVTPWSSGAIAIPELFYKIDTWSSEGFSAIFSTYSGFACLKSSTMASKMCKQQKMAKIAHSWTCGGIGIFGLWGSIRSEMVTKTYENGEKW